MSTIAPPPVVPEPLSVGGSRRLRNPRLAASVALVVGVLLTSLGAGIGVRHPTRTGFTWTSVLGLMTLTAGLAALAFSAVAAWRSTGGWWRLWFIPVVSAALLVMWSIAEGSMLAYAPRNDLNGSTPSSNGLTYSDVTFRTSDGVRLSAWYHSSTNHAAVVTVPGSGSSRTATLGQATVLARHGYGVLMVDPRGQGRSGGEAMDAGWYGDRDITAAVTFLQQQPGIDPDHIGVLGLSMGGEEAIGAAAAQPAIRAVVAEGATHRAAADKAGYLPGGVTGAIQRGLDQLTYGTAALLSRAPEPCTLHTAIARARYTSFLLIAAGTSIDEQNAAAFLRTAAPDRVQTWTVPGASHVQGLTTAPDQWIAKVTAFLDLKLGVTS
jgi:uncharacterized protein